MPPVIHGATLPAKAPKNRPESPPKGKDRLPSPPVFRAFAASFGGFQGLFKDLDLDWQTWDIVTYFPCTFLWSFNCFCLLFRTVICFSCYLYFSNKYISPIFWWTLIKSNIWYSILVGFLGEAFAGQKTTYHSELFDFGGFRVVIIPVVTGIVMGGGRTQIMYMVPEKK